MNRGGRGLNLPKTLESPEKLYKICCSRREEALV
jgi:hypothetical protein